LTDLKPYHKDGGTVLCWLHRAFLAIGVLATLTPALRAQMLSDGVAAGDVSSTDAILWTA
jgi:phosphodiesterase/alkaline phosphatase D-like protein